VAQSWGNIGIALRHTNYRNYQTGRFISHTASWMYKLAIGWLVWKMTHSAAWLGIFGFLDQAPALFIMPLAGALTDRIDALKMLRITQILLVVQGILLAFLDFFGFLNLPLLIVLTLVYGIITAFQLPANQTILPNLMPREALTIAYGLNSVFYNVARFTGPMLAGAVISAWGTAPAILCNAIGAILFMCVLIYLGDKIKMPEKRLQTGNRNMLGEIRDGITYTLKHEGIRPTIFILSALSLFPYTVEMILPSLADGVYHMGAFGLAWMTAILGVGAMLQAALIARRGGVSGLSNYAVQAILWMALAFGTLAYMSNFWLALVCIFVIGFAASATRVSSMTLLQYCVEPNMRGRVASIYGLITHFFPAAGALIVGVLGDRFGLPVIMGVIGVFTLFVWLWAYTRRHDMARALEVEHDKSVK
jgi:MFS family permease